MNKTRIPDIIDGRDPVWGPAPAFVIGGLIVCSVLVLTLETLPNLDPTFNSVLRILEFVFLGLFTVEYLTRLICSPRPLRYATSFFGVIDFLSCIPALLFVFPDLQALRALRLLRVLRLFKLMRLGPAMDRIETAFVEVRAELTVFSLVATIIVFLAAVGMYHLEGPGQPDTFGSIPQSLWWAMSTLTTVGYGDVYPVTAGGRAFTALILLVGLGIVAVPAGIITSALLNPRKNNQTQTEVQNKETPR